jgi:uncharacterized protein (TIGR02466 family)
MQYTLQSFFPTTVLTTNIGREFTKEEMDVVDKHRFQIYKNSGNVTSINTHILDSEFPTIRNEIQNCIQYFVSTILNPKNNLQFFITQSWINYTEPGQFHHKHAHPNSILSGVFYFNAEEGFDKIHFFKESYKQIVIPPKEWNIHNSDSWWLPVKTGDIILFPSSLVHMVETTVSKTTRTSLAFNVFAKGLFGEDETLTSLRL